MEKLPVCIFDDAVTQYFEPLFARYCLCLVKICNGVYEVVCIDFSIRIRQGFGHRNGILITLLPSRLLYYDDIKNIRDEIGLGNIVAFNNVRLGELTIDTRESYMREAERLAKATELYAIPYVLGRRNDFHKIEEYVRIRGEEAVSEIKKYRFPRNVREEWE